MSWAGERNPSGDSRSRRPLWKSSLIIRAAAGSTLCSLIVLSIAKPIYAVPPEPSGGLTEVAAPITQPQAFVRPSLELMLPIAEPPLPSLGGEDLFLPSPEASLYLKIDLSDRRVYVMRGNQVKASFPIAIGRQGWETPTGEFQIIQMQRNPSWQHPFTGEVVPPGRDNPLGVRWIGFWTDGRNYIGFHGTPNENSVGRAASHGCVRMFNRDVVKLFDMVSLGTPVIVVR
jgi:L,D-transpeptidase ErfK/SrfK